MYRELDAIAIRNLLHANTAYAVDTLITYGGHPKKKPKPCSTKLLRSNIQPLRKKRR